MAENKINGVAKLLGIEMEEEFGIKGCDYKYKLSEYGLMFWSDYHQDWFYTSKLEELLLGRKEIIKLPKQILSEEEKEYLSNVIKPFRDRVIYIEKCECTLGEYLEIRLRHYDDGCSCYSIILPYFKKGTMYKNMKLDEEYTLYELGL